MITILRACIGVPIGIYIWNYYGFTIENVSTGMVDEKVTVISSVVHTYIPSQDGG